MSEDPLQDERDSVCIIDFAGNSHEPGMWCDWYPKLGVVCFGGYWCDVPDMKATKEPSEAKCEKWANMFEENTRRSFLRYLKENS